MARPIVSDFVEQYYEALGFHTEDDAEVPGRIAPPRTNLSARPNSEAAALLTSSGSFAVTRVLAVDEGIEPIIEDHAYLSKSVYTGGADSNVGFFAYNFPEAGTYTVTIYCLLASNWDGGGVQFNAEGYAGWAEVDVLAAEAAGKGNWQRVVCRVTVVSGDLSGNLVLRAVPGFPTVGRAMYFDAKQVEVGKEATEYLDGNMRNCEWSGSPNASTSTFLGYDETWPLLQFCAASLGPLGPVYEIVREGDDGAPPWSILWDVDKAPAWALPYLSMFPGVVLQPGMSEEQQRNEIREPTGWRRGQPAAIKIAARRTLSKPDARVIVRPRTPEPGVHFIRTLISETPDPARTEAEIRSELPPWEVLDYEAMAGVTVEDVAASWKSVEALTAAFKSVEDLTDTLPTELPEP